MKQQGIMMFFEKDKSKISKTGNCQNGNEASINRPTASVEQTTQRAYSDKLSVTGKSKKLKGEFTRQYDEKYLELGLTIAPCSEQSPRPLCLVFSQILSNEATKPSKVARRFHSKHNNLERKPLEYFERLSSNKRSKKANEKNNDYQKIISSCILSNFSS